MSKNIWYLVLLVAVLVVVNFLFARLAPADIKDKLLIESMIVAVLDGIVIFTYERISSK